MFQCGIVLAMLLRFQPKIKITDKLPVQFCQHYIITVVTTADIFFQPVYGSIKLGNGAFCIFLANQGTTFFVMLCIHLQQATLYLIPSVETILNCISCYWFVVYFQFTVYLQYFGTNRIDIVVQFGGYTVFSFGTFLFLIP